MTVDIERCSAEILIIRDECIKTGGMLPLMHVGRHVKAACPGDVGIAA
jgi:hypothetical protein